MRKRAHHAAGSEPAQGEPRVHTSKAHKGLCAFVALTLITGLSPCSAQTALATTTDTASQQASAQEVSETNDATNGSSETTALTSPESTEAASAESNSKESASEKKEAEPEAGSVAADAIEDASEPMTTETSQAETNAVNASASIQTLSLDSDLPLISTYSAGGTNLSEVGDEIDEGGLYIIDSAVSGTITVNTSEEVVLTTEGSQASITNTFVLEYASGVVGNVVLNDVDLFYDSKVTSNLVQFASVDGNTLTLEGTNSFTGTKQSRNYTSGVLIAVPSDGSLTVGGTGSINWSTTSSACTVLLFGGIRGEVNGAITFGDANDAPGEGPQINFTQNGAGGGAIGYIWKASNSTAVDGTPGEIKFLSGTYNLTGSRNLIGGPSGSTETTKNLKVFVGAGVQMHIICTGSETAMPNTAVVGGCALAKNGNFLVYDPQNPASGGTFTIEPGAVVRCEVSTEQLLGNSSRDPAVQPIKFSNPYNLIYMNIQSASQETEKTLFGISLDTADLGLKGDGAGTFYYSVDEGEIQSVYLADYSSNKLLPVYLSQKKHVITFYSDAFGDDDSIEGTVTLYPDSANRTFTVNYCKFAINYDLNTVDTKGNTLLYTPSNNSENPTEVSSEAPVTLLEPTCEGYDFAGWYTDEGLKVTQLNANDFDGDINLTAHWTPKYVSVTYPYMDGGTKTSSIQYGKKVTLIDRDEAQTETVATAELKEKLTIPELDEGIMPDEGFLTIGYEPYVDENGDLSLTLKSSMPEYCTVTIVQPEKGFDSTLDSRVGLFVVEQTEEASEYTTTFKVKNGTTLNFQAYPEDGYLFDYFLVNGKPYYDEEGEAAYTYTITNNITLSAQAHVVKYLKASIAADATSTIVDNDTNTGWRLNSNGVQYRLLKTGIRYVKGVVQYVKDYPVYDGDPLYEGDVITAVGEIDDSVVPDDPDYEYVGNVRFAFSTKSAYGAAQESVATYTVKSTEDMAEVDGNYEGLVGNLDIDSYLPSLKKKTWLNVADTSWFHGEGETYDISTPEQLAGIIKLMLDGTTNFKNTTINLTNDISLENNDGIVGTGAYEGKIGTRYWACSDSNYTITTFAGTLNGQGYAISSMVINPDWIKSGNSNIRAGLFSRVSGTVKNLTVEGEILGSTSNSKWFFGGICGVAVAGATFENITANVDITGYSYLGGIAGASGAATYKNCTNNGSITGALEYVGGIVGRAEGYITGENLVNNGTITNAGNTAGGIIGGFYTTGGKLTNCVNNGAVSSSKNVGGITSIASQGSVIYTNCINNGDVTATRVDSTNNLYVGGIVGFASDSYFINCGNSGTIKALIAYKEPGNNKMDFTAQVGGIVGYISSSRQGSYLRGCYNTGTINGTYGQDYLNGTACHYAGVGGLVGSAYVAMEEGTQGYLGIYDSYSSGMLLWCDDYTIYSTNRTDGSGYTYVPGGLVGTWENGYRDTANGIKTVKHSVAATDGTAYGLYISNSYIKTNTRGKLVTDNDTYYPNVSKTPMIGSPNKIQETSTTYYEWNWNADASIADSATLASTITKNIAVFGEAQANLNSGMPLHTTALDSLVELTACGIDGEVDESANAVKVVAGSLLTSDFITDNLYEGVEPSVDEADIPEGYETYEFIGWSTDKDATEAMDTISVPLVSSSDDESASSLKIYPVFTGELTTYTITYDIPETASNDSRNKTTYTIETPNFTLYDATNGTDEFEGWYDNKYFEGNAITSIPEGTTGNLTLYAKFTSSTLPYTITYHLEGGVNDSSNPTKYLPGEAFALNAPTRDGYTFEGWYAYDTLTGDKVSIVSPTQTGDIELWAKWAAIEDSSGSEGDGSGDGEGDGLGDNSDNSGDNSDNSDNSGDGEGDNSGDNSDNSGDKSDNSDNSGDKSDNSDNSDGNSNSSTSGSNNSNSNTTNSSNSGTSSSGTSGSSSSGSSSSGSSSSGSSSSGSSSSGSSSSKSSGSSSSSSSKSSGSSSSSSSKSSSSTSSSKKSSGYTSSSNSGGSYSTSSSSSSTGTSSTSSDSDDDTATTTTTSEVVSGDSTPLASTDENATVTSSVESVDGTSTSGTSVDTESGASTLVVFDWLPWVLLAIALVAAGLGWGFFLGSRRKKEDSYGNVSE